MTKQERITVNILTTITALMLAALVWYLNG